MPGAEHFPLFHPAEAKRVFGSEETLRRVAKGAHWGSGAKLLELGAAPSPASFALIKELGLSLTLADEDASALDALKEKARTQGLADKVDVRRVDFRNLSFAEGSFDGIFALGRMVMPLTNAVTSLRRFLAPKGRVCLTYPVRVGRHPARAVLDHWEKRLGETMLLPRECLLHLSNAGYEPEFVETLSDAELDDYYRAVEPHASAPAASSLREEMDLHRTAGGRGSFSYAIVVGRRKEPGEKPPVSRNE